MRHSTAPLVLILTVLLGACAGSKDGEFKENVSEANFKLGIGYLQSGRLDIAAEKLLKAVQYLSLIHIYPPRCPANHHQLSQPQRRFPSR